MNAQGVEPRACWLKVSRSASELCARKRHAKTKAKLGPEYASCTIGLVLTGEQVKLIRIAKPNLNVCQANVVNNELWVSGLTRFKVKALLTKAQLINIVDKTTRLNAKLVVKNVLTSGQALIKATVVVCKPEKRRTQPKNPAPTRQRASDVFGANIG
ncbi:SsrA-binding protein [Candidatus Hodgkinia cicadicola]|nr:SsrA-binding protein [Candidatus Hodgkinia cicadicola]